MTLFHHDARSYDTALGEMAVHLRERFAKTIAKGASEAQEVLEQIDRDVPRDRIVPGPAVEFIPTGNGVEVMVEKGDEPQAIHDFALRQFCNRGKLNINFARALIDQGRIGGEEGAWAPELLAHNLNKLYHQGPGRESKYLMRSVDNKVRGWLSDAYRRLDCRPLLHAFHKMAIQDAGAVPVRGYALETKVLIRVVMPTVFEPIPNMPMLYGLEWHNSDFGHGAHSLRSFIHVPWCTNQATRDDVLRQYHSGKRLSEDFTYSQKTYKLDQKMAVSALSDVVKGLLSPASIDEAFTQIRKSNDDKLDRGRVPAMLKSLSKAESVKVVELFDGNDNDNMPEGKTRLRLSNAISFLGVNTENKYRAIQLERLAGKVGGLSTSNRGEED